MLRDTADDGTVLQSVSNLEFQQLFILGTTSHSNTVPTRISNFSNSSKAIIGFIGLAL